jgi:hypothetical protein
VTWFVAVVHVTKVIVKSKNDSQHPGIELGTWHDAQNVTDHPGAASNEKTSRMDLKAYDIFYTSTLQTATTSSLRAR